MSSVVAYTFKTFPKTSLLEKEFPHLFIFDKLKQDIEPFCAYLLKVKPDFVIGVAHSKTKSVFEPIAINNIHGHKISAAEPEELALNTPSCPSFPPSPRPSNSFCNYSMFKIQSFINQQQLPSKQIFAHLMLEDIPRLPKIIE